MKEISSLVNHIQLYNDAPKDFKKRIFNTWLIYNDYDGIDELFDKMNKEKILKLINIIKKYIDKGVARDVILEKLDRYHSLAKFILDHYIEYDFDDHIEISKETPKTNTQNKNLFVWRDNQIKGWKTAIDSDFVSGIHSQATGSGKSLIALKTIWEYHKRYPKHHILWICERKDIPQKLFFDGVIKKGGLPHKRNYKFWKDNDIIDMSKFHIVEHVYNKDRYWIKNINNYDGDKPIFLIINRAFMTTRSKKQKYNYRYEEIRKMPKFAIIDECHSCMANETYQLLLYLKFNRGVKIHGLSATPYRSGKSKTNLTLDIDCDEKCNIDTNENEEKLLQIFCKPMNVNQLNLLSFFNLKEAIESGIVLEPIFHWYYMENKKNKKKMYDDNDIHSVFCVLDTILRLCKYKKCIVWCGTIELAEKWYDIFEKHKTKYINLPNIKRYIDHSKIKNNDYDEFYDTKNNTILFCANKFREGSDIPYLSCCLFLDKVMKRGQIPFIQCIGRILRMDNEKLKTNGHILDGCIKEDDESKMKSIVNKIIGYYLHLYEISKSDFEFNDDVEISKSKIDLYNQISQSIHLVPKKKEIIIKLKNDKKIVIDVKTINISTMEWNRIIPKFNKVLKKMIVLSDYEEYVALQEYCIKIGMKDKYDYRKEYKYYQNLYKLDDSDNKIMLDPQERFSVYFKNWYDFLKIDTSNFIETLDEWRKQCKKNKIKCFDDYKKLCKRNDSFPTMPGEFYQGFTNLRDILKSNNNNNNKIYL